MTDDIVARLLRVKYTRERGDGPNGDYWDEPCEADDCGAVALPVNPDGKEAADEIERLLANAKQDAGYLAAYHQWCTMNGCAPSSSDLIPARAALAEQEQS